MTVEVHLPFQDSMITQLASIITINTAEPNTVRERTKNPASKIGREQPPHENASQLPVPREANYATATLNQDTSLSVVKDKLLGRAGA